jgi:formate C-acetyltransferase
MHDTYAYESAQLALHDSEIERLMAFGVAGLSVAADSLSAIRYARVRPIRDASGIAVAFDTEGGFPCFGNNDERVDSLVSELTHEFIEKLRKHAAYRNAIHTLSVLTITSNVMYGKKTGSTPDGRKAGAAFAPGANPMHGRTAKERLRLWPRWHTSLMTTAGTAYLTLSRWFPALWAKPAQTDAETLLRFWTAIC